ncbi:hypothetical protein BDR04DRAFT_1089266 [Suillus decipiens]|nr:hypothetical protein BDR04DRAFT_1089266 [Suillus decipiens]
MTRGTTDLPLCAITFTTPSVSHFMDSVIGIDTYGLQLLQTDVTQVLFGASYNHQLDILKVRYIR